MRGVRDGCAGFMGRPWARLSPKLRVAASPCMLKAACTKAQKRAMEQLLSMSVVLLRYYVHFKRKSATYWRHCQEWARWRPLLDKASRAQRHRQARHVSMRGAGCPSTVQDRANVGEHAGRRAEGMSGTIAVHSILSRGIRSYQSSLRPAGAEAPLDGHVWQRSQAARGGRPRRTRRN